MARPREFDEDKVLEAAGEIFWARGYDGTTTRELSECMGLTPASLYNAFGDKRGLYLRALGSYLSRTLHERIARHEAAPSPLRAIHGFFREVIDLSLADPRHRGCLLVNTALEANADDAELRHLVAEETRAIERFFRRCLVAGQTSGEITAGQSADDMARHLLGLLLGLRVLARVRPEAKLLNGMIRPAMAMLDPRNSHSERNKK